MIILDGLPNPQKRRLSRRSTSSVSDVESIQGSEFGPPSYHSASSRLSVQPMLESDPPHAAHAPTKSSIQNRFCKGLLYALALYAIVATAIVLPYFVTHSHPPPSHPPYQRMRPEDQSNGGGDGDGDGDDQPVFPMNPPIADGTVLGCNLWRNSHQYAYPSKMAYSRLTYCIPHNSTNLWLHALGGGERFVSGDFTVKLNPDEAETDYVVDVLLTYPNANTSARDSSAICLMQERDTWGVGIYTPPDSINHALDYQLALLIPQAKGPLALPNFTTYLPWFSHSFQDLNNSLIFGDVEIGGIASSVDGTISGVKVNVTTSQAAITGSYHATDSLILQTSFAKINTSITLGSTVGQAYPTSLFMRSSQGPFSATVNLSTSGADNSSLDSQSGGRPQYSTRVSCDDSPVTLIFRHDDTVSSSDLDVQVNTTLNRAVVLLDNKFEGNFDLHSTNGSVILTDLEGGEHSVADSLSGPLPQYRRSLEYQRESVSRTRGCVRRGASSTSPDQKVNVQVQNHLALIALGFVKPGDNTPSITGLGL